MKTIKEWQKAAYELAVEKGFHDCRACDGRGETPPDMPRETCERCKGSGRVDPRKPTRIAARLALIHCEISEAVECVARGRMDLYWVPTKHPCKLFPDSAWLHAMYLSEGYKPEGFPIELADVFLRLCDLAESLGVELPEFVRYPDTGLGDPENVAAELQGLHWALDHASWPRDFVILGSEELRAFATSLYVVAGACGVDLLAMAELKHEYNKTRPYRHGDKLL